MGVESIKFADILIKFIEEQYIDSTIENGFFFNTLETFKQSDGLTDEQSDSDEGSSVDFKLPNGDVEVFDKHFKKLGNIESKNLISFKRKLNYKFALKIPICCFTLLKFPYDFSFVKVNQNIYEYKINDKIIKQLDGISGNRPYVWCLKQEMIKQINNEIKKGTKIKAKKVQYYKSEGVNITNEELKKDPYKVIFMKNEKYRNQKEFRVALLERKKSCFFNFQELQVQVSKDANLNNLRLYINKKYDDKHISIQLANKGDDIIYHK